MPAGTTTYEYVDVFVNAAFGAVSITDANALRAAGAAWTVPVPVTPTPPPRPPGGCSSATVLVRTDANVQVGSGDVVIERVTP